MSTRSTPRRLEAALERPAHGVSAEVEPGLDVAIRHRSSRRPTFVASTRPSRRPAKAAPSRLSDSPKTVERRGVEERQASVDGSASRADGRRLVVLPVDRCEWCRPQSQPARRPVRPRTTSSMDGPLPSLGRRNNGLVSQPSCSTHLQFATAAPQRRSPAWPLAPTISSVYGAGVRRKCSRGPSAGRQAPLRAVEGEADTPRGGARGRAPVSELVGPAGLTSSLPVLGALLLLAIWIYGGRAGWASGMVVTPAKAIEPIFGDSRGVYWRAVGRPPGRPSAASSSEDRWRSSPRSGRRRAVPAAEHHQAGRHRQRRPVGRGGALPHHHPGQEPRPDRRRRTRRVLLRLHLDDGRAERGAGRRPRRGLGPRRQPFQRMWLVQLPAAWPSIADGLKLAAPPRSPAPSSASGTGAREVSVCC